MALYVQCHSPSPVVTCKIPPSFHWYIFGTSITIYPSLPPPPNCAVDTTRSGGGLPPKNGLLTSSIGSIMTVTTLAEEEGKTEEVGRVGGWIASFDKLLEDPLGLVCLQVSDGRV